jgi:hypothetical protein
MSMPGRRRRMMAGGLGQLTGCTSVTPPPARNSCSCSTTAMSGTSASGWSAPARRLSPTPSIRGWWPAVARPHPQYPPVEEEWDEQAEDDEELLAQWEQAEAEAVEVLRQALPAPTLAPLPAGELQQACQHLRASLGRHDPAVETLRRAAGLDPPLPADDAELWLAAAGALIAMRESSGLDAELEASVMALELGAKRALNFATYGQTRPAGTAGSTAVSPR